MNFNECPRCNCRSYERLNTHSYCVNCNYSPTLDEYGDAAIPDWALKFLNQAKTCVIPLSTSDTAVAS